MGFSVRVAVIPAIKIKITVTNVFISDEGSRELITVVRASVLLCQKKVKSKRCLEFLK